jgi:hypothetical protein
MMTLSLGSDTAHFSFMVVGGHLFEVMVEELRLDLSKLDKTLFHILKNEQLLNLPIRGWHCANPIHDSFRGISQYTQVRVDK